MKSVCWLLSGVTCLVAFSQSVQAGSLADDLTGELYAMKSVYTAEYAPAAWKKSFTGYDLQNEFNKAMNAIQANPNLDQKAAREILKNFIYAMKDYHTSIQFASTEAATLPFIVQGTDTKFFIMYIDRAKLPESAFPFHEGDELVTFGGLPTVDAVAAVQAEIPMNVPSTDKARAELNLTTRRAARGLNVPQGPITIGVRAAGSSSVANYQMIWEYTPERIHSRMQLNLLTRRHPRMSVDVSDGTSDTPYVLGGRKSFVPNLGTPIWQSADTDIFHAYIYKTADRKLIGYVRIPQYEADDYDKAVAEFARDITLFEATTDSMVIDQVNNPGGSVSYLYALASMLSPQPLRTPLHRMAITQADVSTALDTIDKLVTVKNDADAKKALGASNDGYPISYEYALFNLNYARFIVSEWNAGRKLTTPYWIDGVDQINPAPSHYTKPILVLVNHLDFSGGDFFPTIMQDNRRVTVFGSRTAGAGGYVVDVQVPNNVGVSSFRCTESIAERVNLNPIENLGVAPDIQYDMSENDFTNGYSDYVKAVQTAIGGLTK